MNQRTIVFQVVCAVLGQSKFETAAAPTKDQHKQIVDLVSAACSAGKVDFKDTPANQAKLADPRAMRKYCDGLVNNWLRKDTNLNGGGKYQAKSPGSRAGQGDDQLRELKKCREVMVAAKSDAAKIAIVDKAIATRTEAVAAEKSKLITVDLSKLPAEIQALLAPPEVVLDSDEAECDSDEEANDLTDEELDAMTEPTDEESDAQA